MQEYTVLVCEDEKDIGDAIEIYLKNQGYTVLRAANGKEGLQQIEANTVHLAIVDLMMPVMDGISMIVELRKSYDFPVLILSAKSEEMDKIMGLNIGADDYVTKPFVPLELLARVNSHLRRHQKFMDLQNAQNQNDNVLRVGGIEMNLDTKEVTVDDQPIKLTPMEFKILQLLMEHPGRVFSATQIYETVWQEEAIQTDTVMVHIRRIREKIETDPKHPRYLIVVWGVGYKIEG
ncbi:MAG: response regulator transcription factor [Erysipelotrichaceae bacterium]|nr:response regulator transcription factor [Erysipelotrichaceae bacterium]